MSTVRRLSLCVAVVFATVGCAVIPESRFDEARQSLPNIRAYALEHLKGLTAEERSIIATREPRMGQANFVVYYFWWEDESGKRFATVEASPPPCKGRAVRGRDQ